MTFLLFIAVVVLAIVLGTQSSNAKKKVDYYSMSYRQGYWDGVRASEQEQVSSNDALQQPAPEQAVVTDELPQTANTVEYTDVPLVQDADGYMTALEQTTPAASYAAQPVLSHESAEERHERNRSHTVNIALYVASLLLVSGIILLAQTIGLPSEVKFAIVWLLVLTFYIAGFVIHAHVPILKPAAVAFIGTALAAVPVAGITMYYLITRDAALCWLVTSLIATGMYVYATVTMKSQLLAYVSILSLFIFSCTLPAVAHAQIMWYYVVMILFGSLLTMLAHYRYAWIPATFAAPVTQASPVAVPLALIGSVFSFAFMTPWEYAAVFGAAMVYYAAQAMVSVISSLRATYWIVARCLFMVVVVMVAAALTDKSWVMMSYALAAAGAVNMAVSTSLLQPHQRMGGVQHEVMFWVGYAAALVASVMVANVSEPGNAFIMAVEHVAIVVAALYALLRLRRAEFGWPVLLSMTVLPLVAGYHLASPPVETKWMFVLFMAYSLAALGLRWVRPGRALEASLLYTFVGLWFMITGTMTFTLGTIWAIAWWLAVAIVSYFVVWRERVDGMMILGNNALLVALAVAGSYYKWTDDTTVTVIAWVNAAGFLTLTEYLRTKGERGMLLATIVQMSTVAAAGVLGALTLLLIGDEAMRAATWMTLVGALYYTAWRQRSTTALVFANIAVVVELLLIAAMLHLSWLATMALVVWLPLVGFVGVAEFMRSSNYRSSLIQTMWSSGVASALLFGLLALLAGIGSHEHDAMWRTVAWFGAVSALYYSAYRAVSVSLLYAANVSIVILVGLLGNWAGLSAYQISACMAWFGLVGFYGAAWFYKQNRGGGRVWSAFYLSAIATTVITGLFALLSDSTTDVLAAGTALLGIGAILAKDGFESQRLWMVDSGAIIAMIGFQRMIGSYFPDAHSLLYTHLWAFLAFAIAYLYRTRGQRGQARGRLVVGLAALSFPTLGTALSEGGGAQVLFLVEHVLLVIAGLVYAYRVATWWGAAGVTMAVLYMLKGYTSLLTIAIGLVVIGAVVYVIIHADKKNRPQPPTV